MSEYFVDEKVIARAVKLAHIFSGASQGTAKQAAVQLLLGSDPEAVVEAAVDSETKEAIGCVPFMPVAFYRGKVIGGSMPGRKSAAAQQRLAYAEERAWAQYNEGVAAIRTWWQEKVGMAVGVLEG